MIDAASPIPIHHQLAVLLRSEIDAGAYPSGVRLPTELELCERFGVSRTPARKALVALANEGVIVRFKRRGSFVADTYHAMGEAPTITEPSADDHGWSGLMRSIATGNAPDAAVVPIGWVAELAASGALRPLETPDDPVDALRVPDAVRASLTNGDDTLAIAVDVELHGLWVLRDALEAIGGRPPGVWGDLRAVALSGRDLMGSVAAPFVMAGGAAGGVASVAATWLLLGSTGVGLAGAGPRDLEAAGAEVFLFLRGLIDTGLMSPDVIGYDAAAVTAELRSGRAVAGIGPSSALLDPDRFMFCGLPGSGRAGPEASTMATGRAGVVFGQSGRTAAAEKGLLRRRALDQLPPPSLLTATRSVPVTPHYRLLSASTAVFIEDVISGRTTVEAALRTYAAAAALLAG